MGVSASPEPRSGSAMKYDPVSATIVLFGGLTRHGYLNDTWKFDGSNWQQIPTRVSPPGRTCAGIAYDAALGKLVLFGGYNNSGYLGDTWLWNGASGAWEAASPGTSPPPVTGPMAFTDPANGHADVYGGFDGNFYRLGTWQWTGSDWLLLHPADAPTGRAAAVIALDMNNHKVVLFGGLADTNADNTWSWDGTNWNLFSPRTQPALRYNSAGVFYPEMQMIVIFGGGSGGVELNDTWAWTGTNWQELFPAQSPSPRESFGMAYHEAAHYVVIFGGQQGTRLLGDTWKLSMF